MKQKHQNWMAMTFGAAGALIFAAIVGEPLSIGLGISGGVLAVLIWKSDL